MSPKIWTIGHSTHSIDNFIKLLSSHSIETIADIRRFPGSRRLPQYNKENLESSLMAANIEYHHIEALGGRRNPRPDSRNSAWRVAAFRGYADYMETAEFKSGIDELITLTKSRRVAYLCSEAVWWSCHRSLVSDYLKHQGWTVLHIMSATKADEHPWTKPAHIEEGRLVYSTPGTLNL